MRPLALNWKVAGLFDSDTIMGPAVPELDGLDDPPEAATLTALGMELREAASTNGTLDFAALWPGRRGHPVAWAFATLETDAQQRLELLVGADWTSRWWLDGRLVLDRAGGNRAAPDNVDAGPLALELSPGRHTLLVRVGAGSGGWRLNVFREPAATWQPPNPYAALPDARPTGPETRDYLATGLRLEDRCHPEIVHAKYAAEEPDHRAAGVESRWIQIVSSHGGDIGSPLFSSRIFPQCPTSPEGSAETLRSWIGEMQALGMPVLTWFGLHCCHQALEQHPEWRAVPIEEMPALFSSHRGCPSTPYGDALVDFVVEAMHTMGIDGFWFDWAHFGGCELCVCAACRDRFRAEEGLELPSRVDWDAPAFRRYILWRQRAFMAYLGRLAGEVRRQCPHIALAVNHQYRGGAWWRSAWPLARNRLDLIGGTEASSIDGNSSFQARMVRAYGYRECEVWMGLHDLHGGFRGNASPYAHHALAVMTAGAMPSFGGEFPPEQTRDPFRLLASLINPRREFTGGESVPYVGLHLSQQMGVFFSGRHELGENDLHWKSVAGWEQMLTETQCLTDIVFDDHLNEGDLAHWPVLVMPLSVAISDVQLSSLTAYVERGGVLVAGPHFGACDEWGAPADAARAERLLGCTAQALRPDGDPSTDPTVTIRGVERGYVVVLAGDAGGVFLRTPVRALAVQLADILKRLAPPPVDGDADDAHLALGLFRRPGELLLHLHNAPGRSVQRTRHPNPILHAPAPRDVTIAVRGWPIRSVVHALDDDTAQIEVLNIGVDTRIRLRGLRWGSVLRLAF